MKNPTPLAAWNGSSTGALPACGLVPEETTDAQGVAHLPRDMFLDKSSRPIKRVTLRSPAKLGLEDALFSVQLPPPPRFR